jgi:hypothetical protein
MRRLDDEVAEGEVACMRPVTSGMGTKSLDVHLKAHGGSWRVSGGYHRGGEAQSEFRSRHLRAGRSGLASVLHHFLRIFLTR